MVMPNTKRFAKIAFALAVCSIVLAALLPQIERSPRGDPCPSLTTCIGLEGDGSISVLILLPVNTTTQQGIASVILNGHTYGNGSEVTGLNPGQNYPLSITNVVSGYQFSNWTSNYGTAANNSATSTTISFQCIPAPNCNPTLIVPFFTTSTPTYFSGDAYHANTVNSFSATFTVPQLGGWWMQGRSPPNGTTEIVDWGIGIGGLPGYPSALVVGLNLSGTESRGVFQRAPSFGAFWSTSISNSSQQTKITLGSNTEILPGDSVQVSISPIPGGKAALAVTDMTPHNNVYASGGATVAEPGAASGEWMTWDPFQGRNIFAPTVLNGTVSDLEMNGAAIYQPLKPKPCIQLGSQAPQCLVPSTPAIGGFQWLNAGAGWNESLNSYGHITVAPVTFDPYVATLARVQMAIFPFNVANESRSLGIQVGGIPFPAGSIGNLLYGSLQTITVTGLYKTDFINVTFSSWSSTAGTVTNDSRLNTTLSVSSPGELEALTLAYEYGWAGYANASLASPATIASGTFTVPSTAFNTSQTATSTQIVGIWVGIGGDDLVKLSGTTGEFLWQAGIQIEYNGTGHNLAITPWYEYVGTQSNSTGPNFDRSPYSISSGDSVTVTVWITSGSQCSTRYDKFSVVDSTQHENWTASIGYCAHPVDTSTAEWIAESPGSPLGVCTPSSYCSLPVMGNVTFTALTVDGSHLNLFGPWQANDAAVPVSTQYGPAPQYLNTQLLASPRANAFSVTET